MAQFQQEQDLRAASERRVAARAEAKQARSAWMLVKQQQFNVWVGSMEPEQRFAMIAAPGFVLLVVGGLSALIYFIRG